MNCIQIEKTINSKALINTQCTLRLGVEKHNIHINSLRHII